MQDFAVHALALACLLKGEDQPCATSFALILPWLSFTLGRAETRRQDKV